MTTDLIYDKKYPTSHDYIDNITGEYINCGEVDQEKGFCKTCGIYVDSLNPPIPLEDDEIPF